METINLAETSHINEVKWIPLKDLHKNPKNTNKHPKDQIERLAKIIEYQGWRWPIIADENNMIVAGEGRYLAAQKLKLKKVPVSYQDFIDADQMRAFVTSDNAIASWADLDLSLINQELADFDPSFDIDLLGLKNFTIDVAEKEFNTDEDEVPENVETRCKEGDLWILGEHRLLCGDSTNIQHVERLMGGEKADMVFTDPPYGINESAAKRATRETNSLAKSGKDLKEFVDDSISYAIDAFNICQSLEIPIQIWFGANYYCHSLPQTNNWLVWDKRLEEKQTDNNSDAELAWVQDGRSSVRLFRHLWKGLIKGSEHGSKRVHPTQKPIALAEWCLQKYDKAKSCLDLFGGSGSTLIACEKTNRKCYMMELDPHYCDVIIERWEKFTGKKAELNGEKENG